MLTTMRKAATSLFIKALLVVLIGSFVFWGVHDVFNANRGNATIATMGGESIPTRDYQVSFEQTRERFTQMMGNQPLSGDMLEQMGLPRMVLENMINEHLLRMEGHKLGLRIPDDIILEATRKNQTFAGPFGGFDVTTFRSALQSVGLSEKAYQQQMQEAETAQLMTDLVLGQEVLHPVLAHTLYVLRQERRDVGVWIFNQTVLTKPIMPTDANLKDYYDKHPKDFQAPEMRTLGVVYFDISQHQAGLKVTDEAIAQAYAQDSKRFQVPEQRQVDQLLFETEEAAKAARAKIGEEANFEMLAKSLPVRNKRNVHLGKISREKALSGTADTIFSLKQGGVSAPVQSPLGWHVFHVTGIEPGRTKSLADATPQIRAALLNEQAEDSLYKQMEGFEEALGNGGDLAEAAKTAGVNLVQLPPVNAAGLDAAGKPVKDIPQLQGLLDKAFRLRKGESTSALSLPDGRSVVVGVVDIAPAHAKPFDSVKGEITQRWVKEEKAQAVQVLAAATARLHDKAGLEARKVGAFRANVKNLKRLTQASLRDVSGRTVSIPPDMMRAIFATKEGEATPVSILDSGDAAFAVVEHITPAPDITKADAESDFSAVKLMTEELRGQVGNSLHDLYTEYLRKKYPVTVNEGVLKSFTRRDEPRAEQ